MSFCLPSSYFRRLNSDGEVDLFACLVDGHLHGPAWRGTLGGGFLVSPSLEFTSDDTVFLYPDCLTALVGRFEDGVMLEARAGRVAGAAGFCGPRCGAVRPAVEAAAEGEVTESCYCRYCCCCK